MGRATMLNALFLPPAGGHLYRRIYINKKRSPVKDDLSLYNGFSWLIKQVADAKLHLPA